MTTFLFTVGIIFVLLSFFFRSKFKNRKSVRINCIGTVLRIESDVPGRDGTDVKKNRNIYPVVRFSDESGMKREHRVISGVLRSRVEVGDDISIHYPPGRPEKVESDLASGMPVHLFLLVLAGFCLIGALLSLIGPRMT
jgi:hypothetical protein